jgi:hypothetical protein
MMLKNRPLLCCTLHLSHQLERMPCTNDDYQRLQQALLAIDRRPSALKLKRQGIATPSSKNQEEKASLYSLDK